ncbi:hypothetical protein ACKLNR_007029 [Fusarium oxysporum f. sp. zingiberi]
MTIQQDGEIRILGERYLAVLFACDVTEVNTSSRSIDCLALRRHRTLVTAEAACCQTEGLCGFGHVVDGKQGPSLFDRLGQCCAQVHEAGSR